MSATEGRSGLPEPEDCDLVLTVSNQSYIDDPVVLTVWIDDVELISEPFDVGNQHQLTRFALLLGPGTHHLKVSSDTGVVREERFTLSVRQDRQYAAISYYNYEDEDGKLIDWHIQSKPTGVR